MTNLNTTNNNTAVNNNPSKGETMMDITTKTAGKMARYLQDKLMGNPHRTELGYLFAQVVKNVTPMLEHGVKYSVLSAEIEETPVVAQYTVFKDDMGEKAENLSISLHPLLEHYGIDPVEFLVSAKVLRLVDGEYVGGKALVKLLGTIKESYGMTTKPVKGNRRNSFVKKRPKVGESLLRRNVREYLEHQKVEVNKDLAQMSKTILGDILTIKEKDRNHEQGVMVDNAYVVEGALTHDAGYFEWVMDWRGRWYQANCFGPNHQASDLGRALLDYSGDFTDYEPSVACGLLIQELQDMCKMTQVELQDNARTIRDGAIGFIKSWYDNTNNLQEVVKKPWSFVKAMGYLADLLDGKKPNIKMGFGLDAKCSGPQLGAIVSNDEFMMAACGLLFEGMEGKSDDPYQMAVNRLYDETKVLVTRNGIKKAYMAAYYGAGWKSFLNEVTVENVDGFYDTLYGGKPSAEMAKALHKAILSTFGKMKALMDELKKNAFDPFTQQRLSIAMPDGFNIEFDYREVEYLGGEFSKDYLEGLKETFGGKSKEFAKQNAKVAFKIYVAGKKDLSFDLPHVVQPFKDHEEEARKTWVNFIQGLDSLVASLIIDNCRMAGITHVSPVHDCFRVPVTQYHLLQDCITQAYMELFGQEVNQPTVRLPRGTNLLGLVFKSVEAISADTPYGDRKKLTPTRWSQFNRCKENGSSLRAKSLVGRILNPKSYYFDK